MMLCMLSVQNRRCLVAWAPLLWELAVVKKPRRFRGKDDLLLLLALIPTSLLPIGICIGNDVISIIGCFRQRLTISSSSCSCFHHAVFLWRWLEIHHCNVAGLVILLSHSWHTRHLRVASGGSGHMLIHHLDGDDDDPRVIAYRMGCRSIVEVSWVIFERHSAPRDISHWASISCLFSQPWNWGWKFWWCCSSWLQRR